MFMKELGEQGVGRGWRRASRKPVGCNRERVGLINGRLAAKERKKRKEYDQ
jgi:hypothetical protein